LFGVLVRNVFSDGFGKRRKIMAITCEDATDNGNQVLLDTLHITLSWQKECAWERSQARNYPSTRDINSRGTTTTYYNTVHVYHRPMVIRSLMTHSLLLINIISPKLEDRNLCYPFLQWYSVRKTYLTKKLEGGILHTSTP